VGPPDDRVVISGKMFERSEICVLLLLLFLVVLDVCACGFWLGWEGGREIGRNVRDLRGV
jgi:hypothetical protein